MSYKPSKTCSFFLLEVFLTNSENVFFSAMSNPNCVLCHSACPDRQAKSKGTVGHELPLPSYMPAVHTELKVKELEGLQYTKSKVKEKGEQA